MSLRSVLPTLLGLAVGLALGLALAAWRAEADPRLARLDAPGEDDDAKSADDTRIDEEDTSERFDGDVLEGLGYSAREIERIRESWDAHTMQKLAADEQSRRGLGANPNFPEMRRALREELGDDQYDAMLYATGQSNRGPSGASARLVPRRPGRTPRRRHRAE